MTSTSKSKTFQLLEKITATQFQNKGQAFADTYEYPGTFMTHVCTCRLNGC